MNVYGPGSPLHAMGLARVMYQWKDQRKHQMKDSFVIVDSSSRLASGGVRWRI